MKNTPENILKLLKARREVAINFCKKGVTEQLKKDLLHEIVTLDEIISYFEDEKYFEAVYKIFIK